MPAGPSVSAETAIDPKYLKTRWAECPWNNPTNLNQECLIKLKEFYDIGKNNKKRKVGSERVYQILMDTTLVGNWLDFLDVTVPKIKDFFQWHPTSRVKL